MKKKRAISVLIVMSLVVSCLFAFTACNNNGDGLGGEVEYLQKPTGFPESVTPGFGFTNEFSNTPDRTEPYTGELKNITFLLDWAPNTNHTGLYVAKNKGYFAAEGLNVNIIQPSNTGQSGSVAAGNAQYGIDFQEQMIFHEKEGVNVTAISAIINHNTSGIISKKTSNIKTPADMVNHKYATWGMPGEQSVIYGMLKNAGVDPTTLPMVPNTVENIVAEFTNPTGCECVWSYAAWDKIACDVAGLETNFIYMRDYGLDYYTPVIVVNNDYKDQNPEEVKAFLRAVKKGYEFCISNPDEAATIMMNENPELKANEDLIKRSQTYLAGEYKSDAPYWGHIDQARWDGFFATVCNNAK